MDKAVAVRYDERLPAPIIVAKGRGHLAEMIRTVARRGGVPIVEDRDLADCLIELDPGDFIPEQYYEIIAELLVFVCGLGRRP